MSTKKYTSNETLKKRHLFIMLSASGGDRNEIRGRTAGRITGKVEAGPEGCPRGDIARTLDPHGERSAARHRAGNRRAKARQGSWSQTQDEWKVAPRFARSLLFETAPCRVRSRVLLAPPPRMQSRDDSEESPRLLDREVQIE